MKTWTCGDCHHTYPMSVRYCRRPFDDYLSLRGGSVETAIMRAVMGRIKPMVRRAEARIDATRLRWRPDVKYAIHKADARFAVAA